MNTNFSYSKIFMRNTFRTGQYISAFWSGLSRGESSKKVNFK